MVVLMFLTLLGTTVMNQVNEDLTVVRNLRQSDSALAVAEAGVQWGMQRLNETYALETTEDYNAILSDSAAQLVAVSDSADPICAGLDAARCLTWKSLTPGDAEVVFLAADGLETQGVFRAAIGDDVEEDGDFTVDSNDVILLRAWGRESGGAVKLLEVALTVE